MMSFLPMHLFLLVAVIYFILAWPLSILTRRVEVRMQRGRRTSNRGTLKQAGNRA